MAGDGVARPAGLPLDPTIKAMLALSGGLAAPARPGAAPEQADPEQARAVFRAFTVAARSPTSVAAVRGTENLLIDGPRTRLPARIYWPERDLPAPTVVFFHGGGFVIGDLDTHDNHCRWLTRETGAVVVSVGYRRAPESPFPAAVHDSVAAVRWAAGRVAALGGLPDRLAVAGDSAGGNLAAVAAQVCRDDGGPALCAQLLVYPVVDLSVDADYPSRRRYADGYLLTGDAMRWFRSCYLRPDHDATSPLASPLHGELAGLPPAVVATMEFDPLCDEGETYAAALAAAGVHVVPHRFAGLIHGSFELPVLPPSCADAMRTAFGSFRELLARSPVPGSGGAR